MVATVHIIATICQVPINVERYIYMKNVIEVSKVVIGVFRYFWDVGFI